MCIRDRHYGNRLLTHEYVHLSTERLLVLVVSFLLTHCASAQYPPGLVRVQPAKGRAGATVGMTIHGTNFNKGMVVKVGSLSLPTRFVGARELRAAFAIPRDSS